MFSDINPIVAASVVTAFAGSIIGIFTAFAKAIWWLAEEFKDVRRYVRTIYDEHEEKDAQRHSDNLVRFTTLEVLIKKNGNH